MIDLGELIVDLSILGVYPLIVPGGGSVTNVGTGTGLTGGPITGSGVISFADVSTLTVLANITGGTAPPIPNTLSDILDATFDNSQGDILYRGASGWTYLAPSTAGYFLKTGGPAADPTWAAGAIGTVTQVNSGLGLTGGPITGSGTLSLANIAVGDVLANVGGFSAAPNAVTVTDLFDFVFGQSQGQLLYRGASVWESLTPSTAGYILQTGGLLANPSWIPNEGLAAINDGDLLANTSGSSAIPVDTSLTTLLDYVFGNSQGDILYRGASAWGALAPSTSGYFLQTGGPAVDPSWAPPPSGGSPFYLDPVLDVLDASIQTIVCTYYNGAGNDGIGATLTNNDGLFTVFTADGDTPPVGSAILVLNSYASNTGTGNDAWNGIYVLTVAGDGVSVNWVLERRADCNQTSNIINGISVFVFGGDSNNYPFTSFILSNGVEPFVPLVIGTDGIYFNQSAYGNHFINGLIVGNTDTPTYLVLTGNAIGTGIGGNVTIVANSGGGVQLQTNSIVVGTGSSFDTIISYATDATNNFHFGTGTQTFNIAGVAQISLSTSGVQIGSGATVTTISTDGTFAGAVDTTLSTSLAIKTYVDAQIGGSGAVNPGLTNELAYYAAAGDAVSGLTTANSSVCVTDSGGVPSFSTTLPNSIDLGIPSALDATNATGTAAGLTAGTVTTNANLTGDVTSVGNATTLTNSAVTSQPLTGYAISSGTVLATDSILQAIEKIAGNAGGGGTVLSVQTFTSGSGTYTPTAGANYIWVRAVGGGGGGGGSSATTNGNFSYGSCGGSGGYAEHWGVAASLAYSVGTAGAGGVAASAGSNGGVTTFGTAGALITVGGGLGGLTSGSFFASSFSALVGGSGGTATTGGLLIPGTSGDSSKIMLLSGSVNYAVSQGAGPASMLGLSIPEQVSIFNLTDQVSNGLTLNTGYGSGGGGGASYRNTSTSSSNGGDGRTGVIIITEYA